MGKKIFIFDYDGVIVDTFDVFFEYFMKGCEKEKVSKIKTKDDFLRLYNGNMYESMFKMGMSKEKILRIVYTMKDGLLEHQDKIDLFPGIQKVIKTLSKDNLLYIVTSSETDLVIKFLKIHGINQFFEDVIGSDKEHNKIKKIKSIKEKYPDGCFFYIGDTAGDIVEGRNADVKTVAVGWGWHGKNVLLDENPDFFIEKSRDLLNFC
jgi:phosphoglycolate phosphatase